MLSWDMCFCILSDDLFLAKHLYVTLHKLKHTLPQHDAASHNRDRNQGTPVHANISFNWDIFMHIVPCEIIYIYLFSIKILRSSDRNMEDPSSNLNHSSSNFFCDFSTIAKYKAPKHVCLDRVQSVYLATQGGDVIL